MWLGSDFGEDWRTTERHVTVEADIFDTPRIDPDRVAAQRSQLLVRESALDASSQAREFRIGCIAAYEQLEVLPSISLLTHTGI